MKHQRISLGRKKETNTRLLQTKQEIKTTKTESEQYQTLNGVATLKTNFKLHTEIVPILYLGTVPFFFLFLNV